MTDERANFLDRASIAFAATGMNAASACALAEKLLEERIAQDARRAEAEHEAQAARMTNDDAKAIAAALDAAESVQEWSRGPWVAPVAEEAFNERLAARGLAVWSYGHEAWIVSKAQHDETERLLAAIREKHARETDERNAKYAQERRESAKKAWESNMARLRAEARS